MAIPPDDPSSRPQPPALAVLLACLRPAGDEASTELQRALDRVFDWDELQAAALYHGLVPLLSRRVSESGSAACPREKLATLQAYAAATERRSLRMGAQLLRILDVLARRHVAALPVKGPVLAHVLYGDLGLRHFADLDIAIRPRDLATARDALLESGFRLVAGEGIELTRLLSTECELAFALPEHDLVVELHWRLGPRFANASLSADGLIDRARPAEFLGREVLSLARDDLFIVLCVHGAYHHRWDRLELVSALGAWAAAADASEWRPMLERAASLGCLRRCIVGCLLARDVARCRLPADVNAYIDQDARAARLARKAEAVLLSDHRGSSTTRDGLAGLVWESLALDRPAATATHFIARALTPGSHDWGFGAVPPRLPALYYLLRPIRLAAQAFRRGDTD